MFLPKVYINESDQSRDFDKKVGWIRNNVHTKALTFTSDSRFISIRVKGKGTITITDGNYQKMEFELTPGEVNEYNYTYGTVKKRTFRVEGTLNVSELDLHGNGITNFHLGSENKLKKLVLYDNKITSLNTTNLKNLQFLHIHNNPICDDVKYITKLRQAITSLPNRTGRAMGSIVFYPWYGLETLIFDEVGTYTKYPSHKEYTLTEGTLYGIVDQETKNISYCTYTNGEMIAHEAMNRHHQLRKEFETSYKGGCLKKNWLFGSAIQYHDDYRLCYHYFRDTHVQDMWETAEKGFGMCIGSIDQFAGLCVGWDNMNVLRHLDMDGKDIQSYTPDFKNWSQFTSGNWSHGDFIWSQLFGRGDGIVYGLCPNASSFAVDGTYNNGTSGLPYAKWPDRIKDITDNCTSYTSSYNVSGGKDDANWQRTRYYLGIFGKDNIITSSGGNNNDGVPWTYEQQTSKAVAYGNYGTEENMASTENHSNTFYVASLNPLRQQSGFSNSSVDANVANFGGFRAEDDYLSSYGDMIPGCRNYLGARGIAQGTSMASPNCNGTLALFRVIYQKMSPNCKSFGKGSEFMNYVKTHWLDHNPFNMAFAVGMGFPDILAEPKPMWTPHNNQGNITMDLGAKVGEELRMMHVEFCDNKDTCKPGFTADLDMYQFAQVSPTEIIPIRPGTGAITLYSQGTTTNYPLNRNYLTWSVSHPIESNGEFTIIPSQVGSTTAHSQHDCPYTEAIETDTPVVIAGGSEEDLNSTDFTVQFAMQFSPENLFPELPNTPGTYETSTLHIALWNIDEVNYQELCVVNLDVTVAEDGTKTINFVNSGGNGSQSKFYQLSYPNQDFPQGNLWGNKRLRIQNGDIGIVTITFKDGWITYYYNGTIIGCSYQCDKMSKLKDLCVISKPLVNDSCGDVVFYNRVLTHKEIVNNTIAMIQREEGV